jgi:hypothetical protein
VKDASGQKLGYFHFEDEPGRRTAAKLLTKDQARRIAADVAEQMPRQWCLVVRAALSFYDLKNFTAT